MDAHHPPRHINCLPSAVLGLVFSLAGPSSAMAVLTTCRQWHQAAVDDCPSLWRARALDGRRLARLLAGGGPAKAGLLAGWHGRAAALRHLTIAPCGAAVAAELPGMLEALRPEAGGALSLLRLDLRLTEAAAYTSCCQAIGQLRTLRQLELLLDLPGVEPAPATLRSQGLAPMPLECLAHLSTLTELRGLTVDLPFSGAVPEQGVFDHMLHLTRLHFLNKWGGWQEAGEEEGVPFVTLPWRRPAPPGSEGRPDSGGGGGGSSCTSGSASAAPLLDLQLQSSILGIPPADVLRTLCQLTVLGLADIEMDAGDEIDDAWMAALPRLETLQRLGLWKTGATLLDTTLPSLPRLGHLTSLTLVVSDMQDPDPDPGQAMAAVLGCSALRELALGGTCLADSEVAELPAGALQHLTRLEIAYDVHVLHFPAVLPLPPSPLVELPALKALSVTTRGVTLFIDPGFTRLAPTLEDLRCARCEFEQQSPVGAFVQLGQLTRLDLVGSLGVTWDSTGAVLPRLRYLNPGFDGSSCIPAIALAAPGVEELDLSSSVPLFPEDDTEPLRGLHALRRLVVTLGGRETQEETLQLLRTMQHLRTMLPGVEVVGVPFRAPPLAGLEPAELWPPWGGEEEQGQESEGEEEGEGSDVDWQPGAE